MSLEKNCEICFLNNFTESFKDSTVKAAFKIIKRYKRQDRDVKIELKKVTKIIEIKIVMKNKSKTYKYEW